MYPETYRLDPSTIEAKSVYKLLPRIMKERTLLDPGMFDGFSLTLLEAQSAIPHERQSDIQALAAHLEQP